MATPQLFGNMLTQYLPYDLLKQELLKRDYMLSKVKHDESWRGGPIQVPFEMQHGSTIEFGALAADSDISNYKYGRGSIASMPEAWASLQFLHRDLITHDGKMSEATFLRILPDQIEQMLNTFRMTLGIHLLGNDGRVAKLTANGGAGGTVAVDRIDRFTLDQKIVLKDGDTAAATYYVTGIIIDTNTLTVSATRGGAVADVSAYTIAQGAAVYHPGALTAGMTSLGSQLLSAANGGTTNIFGLAKTSAPFLQCPNYDGTSISASNILAKLFDAYTQRMIKAKSGNLPEVLMSFKHFGNIITQLESQKGAYNVVPNSRKANVYGYQEISIGSVSGAVIKIVAIQEMPDDLMYFMDWDSVTFYSNGLIRRRKSPDGVEYYQTRTTAGYSYIIDHFVMGDLVVSAPWKNLVVYGINY